MSNLSLDLKQNQKSTVPTTHITGKTTTNKLSFLTRAETSISNGFNNVKKDIGGAINTAENFAGSAIKDVKHVALDAAELSPIGLAYNAYTGNLTNMQAYQDIKTVEKAVLPQSVKDAVGMGTVIAIIAGGVILYYAYEHKEQIMQTISTAAKTGANVVGKTYVPGFQGFQ